MISGNIGREPELRFSQSGNAVLKFSICSSYRYKQNGEDKELSDWVNIIAFGKIAEKAADQINKGDGVIVHGRIHTGSYTNAEGRKIYTTDVIADTIGKQLSSNNTNKQETSSNKESSSDKFGDDSEESIPF